jgi:hypothetical protein
VSGGFDGAEHHGGRPDHHHQVRPLHRRGQLSEFFRQADE